MPIKSIIINFSAFPEGFQTMSELYQETGENCVYRRFFALVTKLYKDGKIEGDAMGRAW
jgi:hypothetical protein